MKKLLQILVILLIISSAQAEDARTYVELPAPMREHMLSNMRDHLATLAKASELIANKKWEEASDLIEKRIGMSSLETHGASHMAKFMPKTMQEAGTEMHRSASRLSRSIVEEDPLMIFENYSAVMTRCNACHVQFRVN